jgi:phage-related protein (TIGR01555 family)
MAKPHIRLKARRTPAAHPTADSFQNFLTRTGHGTGNLNDGAKYGFNPVSRNRLQMEYTYRSSWLAGMVVDAYAEDMTRAGVEIHSSDKPDALEELHKNAQALQVWEGMNDTLTWSRLYGGAIGWLMIDGQDTETPLRVETVGKDQFRGIHALDRWAVQPSLAQLVTDLGPDLGKPMFYDLLPDVGTGLQKMRIHYSRVLRFIGVKLPYWQLITENYWGQSVLERLWDRMIAFDSTSSGAAQLVYRAHLRTFKVDKLREIIAMGGPALDGLVKHIAFIRAFQSNEGMTVLDKTDEFETHQYTFAGLEDVMNQFGMQVSGAAQIPLVRLFGQSPKGMNATGEADLRNYYDGCNAKQERVLRNPVEKVYNILYRSTFGREPPKVFGITFKPLWQMTNEAKAAVTGTVTTAVKSAYDSQIIKRSTALQELKQLAPVTGAFSNITDDEIKEAESDPAPTPEALGLEIPKPDAGPGKPGQAGTAKH